jgi:hypothetical protein
MTHAERKAALLKPDVALFVETLDDEQRIIFLQVARQRPELFIMPLMAALSDWWLGLGKVEQAVLTDNCIKRFYIEALPAEKVWAEVSARAESAQQRKAHECGRKQSPTTPCVYEAEENYTNNGYCFGCGVGRAEIEREVQARLEGIGAELRDSVVDHLIAKGAKEAKE